MPLLFRGYQQKMHSTQSTSGLIPHQLILIPCQSTNHHMNSKLREDVNSSGKPKKQESGKKYSILSHTPVCHQFNNLANLIHK